MYTVCERRRPERPLSRPGGSSNRPMNWHVYIIRCTDNSLYTGITNDVRRRMAEHGGNRGAKYFRGRAPRELVYVEGGHSRSSASQREAEIKKMQRAEKERLIASHGDQTPAADPGL